MVAQAGGRAARLGPASVADTDGRVFVADGQLQDALIPPRWGYAGHDGPFAVFVDHFARGPLGLQALPGRSVSGASVRAVAGPAGSPAVADVSSRPRRPGHPVGGGHGRVDRDLASPPRRAGARWPCTGTASSRPSTCQPGGAS